MLGDNNYTCSTYIAHILANLIFYVILCVIGGNIYDNK